MTLLESLVRDKMYEHPLPWTLDYDWLVEVVDPTGRAVHKLMTRAAALELISIAERLAAEDAAFDVELQHELEGSL
jgi:hypothetical protein